MEKLICAKCLFEFTWDVKLAENDNRKDYLCDKCTGIKVKQDLNFLRIRDY